MGKQRNFALEEIEVVKQSPEDVRRMRRQKLDHKKDYQTHHIIPLSLGGTNDPDNLCILSQEQHSDVHRSIDKQILDMHIGQKRTIEIPRAVEQEFVLAGYDLVRKTENGNRFYRKKKTPTEEPHQ